MEPDTNPLEPYLYHDLTPRVLSTPHHFAYMKIAEGARGIAAFGGLHVRAMVRGGEHARGEVVIKEGLQRIGVRLHPLADGDDTFQLVGADEGIHFGEFGADIAAEPLHQAAGDDQFPGAADFLVLGHLQDGVDGLLFGGVDETARVDHEDVGLIGMGGEFVPSGDELTHHDFTIDEVFGTAQTDETDFQACVPTLRGGSSFRIASRSPRKLLPAARTRAFAMRYCLSFPIAGERVLLFRLRLSLD